MKDLTLGAYVEKRVDALRKHRNRKKPNGVRGVVMTEAQLVAVAMHWRGYQTSSKTQREIRDLVERAKAGAGYYRGLPLTLGNVLAVHG